MVRRDDWLLCDDVVISVSVTFGPVVVSALRSDELRERGECRLANADTPGRADAAFLPHVLLPPVLTSTYFPLSSIWLLLLSLSLSFLSRVFSAPSVFLALCSHLPAMRLSSFSCRSSLS